MNMLFILGFVQLRRHCDTVQKSTDLNPSSAVAGNCFIILFQCFLGDETCWKFFILFTETANGSKSPLCLKEPRYCFTQERTVLWGNKCVPYTITGFRRRRRGSGRENGPSLAKMQLSVFKVIICYILHAGCEFLLSVCFCTMVKLQIRQQCLLKLSACRLCPLLVIPLVCSLSATTSYTHICASEIYWIIAESSSKFLIQTDSNAAHN